MTNERKFELKLSACRRLADIAGIEGDLSLCIKACDEFLSNASSMPPGFPTIGQEALAEYAIFRYCRTLSTDVRSGVRIDQINSLTPELVTHHRHFKDLRDKHLAHSVNYHELNSVQATVTPDRAATVLKLGTHHERQPATSYTSIRRLKDLAEALSKIISTERRSELDKIWHLLESMTPEERTRLSLAKKEEPKFRRTNARRPTAGG